MKVFLLSLSLSILVKSLARNFLILLRTYGTIKITFKLIISILVFVRNSISTRRAGKLSVALYTRNLPRNLPKCTVYSKALYF